MRFQSVLRRVVFLFACAALLRAGAGRCMELDVRVVTIDGDERRQKLNDTDPSQTLEKFVLAAREAAEISIAPVARSGEGTALYLRNGDVICNLKIVSGDDTKLALKSDVLGELNIENKFVDALSFAGKDRPAAETIESFLKAPKAKEDALLLNKGEPISGYLEKFSDREITFNAGGQSRAYSLEQIAALRLAPLEDFKPNAEAVTALLLRNGSRLTGKLLPAGQKSALSLEGIGQQPWKIPVEAVAGFEFKGGKLVHLSQLAPSAVDEQPYVGGAPQVFHWRKDTASSGGRLTIGDKEFARGLGVRAYSKLAFALDKQYAKFACIAGLDAAAGAGAVCAWSVVVDGKPAASGVAKADGMSADIKLDVSGASHLELICDFGPDATDAGAHFDWANARLIKP